MVLHGRDPSYDQMRVLAYMGLHEGATGLMMYSYTDLWRRAGRKNETRELFDRRWAQVKPIAKELVRLCPILARATLAKDLKLPNPDRESHKVHFRAVTLDGKIYLIVVNVEDSLFTRHLRVTLPPGKWQVDTQFEYDIISKMAGDNELEVYVPPMGADVIVLKKSESMPGRSAGRDKARERSREDTPTGPIRCRPRTARLCEGEQGRRS